MVRNASGKRYKQPLFQVRPANGGHLGCSSLEPHTTGVSLRERKGVASVRSGHQSVPFELGLELQSECMTLQFINLFRNAYDIVVLLMEPRQVSVD